MLNKFKTFIILSHRKKILFISASLIGYYAYYIEALFKRKLNFGKELLPPYIVTNMLFNPSEITTDITWAIFMAHKFILVNNVCRHQAFQAKILLQLFKIPYKVYIGVKKDEAGITKAHAWTHVNENFVTGFCNTKEYLILNVYANEN